MSTDSISSPLLELYHQAFVPPFRFGFVDEGLSRGAYPTLRNFRYLARLRLSTIISLVPEQPNNDLVDYANAAGNLFFSKKNALLIVILFARNTCDPLPCTSNSAI